MPSQDPDDLCTQTASWLPDQVISRFQVAWQSSEPPSLHEFVGMLPGLDLTILSDLIRIDLAKQLERGRSPQIEDYLLQFPALTLHAALVADLIEEEFRLLSRRDPAVTFARYIERFPKYQSELSTRNRQHSNTADNDARQDQTASWGTRRPDFDTKSVAPASSRTPKIPSTLGRFAIRRWLGAGAFGDVYEAFDPQLDRTVAIKVAKQTQGFEAQQVARFQREAKAAAGLRHPHIVPVYEFGQHEDQFYIASAFIRGETLRDRIRSIDQFEISEAVRIVRQLAEALAYSHEQGIVHRDLKPANVMLDENNSPMLMDFGLASRLNQEDELTLTGQQLGTPLYMSPEQARGKEGAAIAASDQYSLGVMLYELITGKTPFTGTVEMLMFHQQATEPPSPRSINPAISRDLETVCLKCLQKDPAKRYGTTRELVDDLRRLEAGDPIRARRESLISKAMRRVRRNPLTAASLTVVCALLVASVWIWSVSREQRATALVDRQLAEIKSRIEKLIENVELTPGYLAEADRLAAELDQFPQQSSVEARTRIQRTFADKVRSRFRDRLVATDVPLIHQAIDELVKRDSNLAAELRADFAQRQTTWQLRVNLQPPFEQLEQVFNATRDKIEMNEDATRLRRGPRGEDRISSHVGSNLLANNQLKTVTVFAPNWTQTKDRLAIKFSGSDNQWYSFSVVTDTARHGEKPGTFAELAKGSGNVGLIIDRTLGNDTHIVASREMSARELLASCPADRSLRIEVRREGTLLSLVVNQLPVLEFDDAIPLSTATRSRVSLSWPPEVELQSFSTYERALPVAASALEHADDCFNRREFEAAAALYDQVASNTVDEDVRLEALYKIGLCTEAQGDATVAIQKYEFVAENSPPDAETHFARWSALSNCRLLKLYLAQRSPAGFGLANRVLDRLALVHQRNRVELRRLVSSQDRNRIVYDAGGVGLSLLTRSPKKLIEDCERVERVVDMLDQRAITRLHPLLTLVRAYRMNGDSRAALNRATSWLKEPDNFRAEVRFSKEMLAEYVWILLEQGSSPEKLKSTLKEVDSWLFADGGGRIRSHGNASARGLLIERARLLIALDRWDEAQADLERYVRESDDRNPEMQPPFYTTYSEACLLLGYLHERAGRVEEAQRIWKKPIWKESSREFFGLGSFPMNGAPLTNHMVLSALTGDSGSVDPQQLLIGIMTGGTGDVAGTGNSLVKNFVGLIDLDPQLVQRALSTPKGKEWCRKIAFRQLSFTDFARVPAFLCVTEFVRKNAFRGELSGDAEAVVWEFLQRSMDQYHAQNLTDAKIVICLPIWKGVNVPGFVGWTQAGPVLPVELRGHLAYIFGHRFQVLNRRSEAESFLREALQAAPADSLLQKEAQHALDNLPGASN